MTAEMIRIRKGNLTGRALKSAVESGFDPAALLTLPDDPAKCCKRGRTVQAAADGTFFVKRFCHRNLWKSFCHIFKARRPEICLRSAAHIAAGGIDTPQVFAALRKYRRGLPQFDYLITQDISSSAVFADKMPLSAELAEKLVILLADLHRMGVEHGDVSLRNLYCTVSGSWGVIDLDNCRIFSGSLPPERRIRELARLASSFLKLTQGVVPDGMEPDIPGFFARIYCRCSGFDPECSAYRKRVAYLAERKRKQYV